MRLLKVNLSMEIRYQWDIYFSCSLCTDDHERWFNPPIPDLSGAEPRAQPFCFYRVVSLSYTYFTHGFSFFSFTFSKQTFCHTCSREPIIETCFFFFLSPALTRWKLSAPEATRDSQKQDCQRSIILCLASHTARAILTLCFINMPPAYLGIHTGRMFLCTVSYF